MQNFGKARAVSKIETLLRLANDADMMALRQNLVMDPNYQHWLDDFDVETQKLWVFGDPAIGFILLQIVLDEAEIIMLWVTPHLRGKGLAGAALKQLLEILRADNIKTVFLEVAKDNIAAIKIYEKASFLTLSIRKQYYKRNNDDYCDAIVMRAAI